MALIDELKYKLKSVEQRIDEKHTQIREIGSILEVEEAYRNDLDRAIAALSPQDAPLTAAVAEPEIPEGWERYNPASDVLASDWHVEVIKRNGDRTFGLVKYIGGWAQYVLPHDTDVIAYRIIEASTTEEANRIEGASEVEPVPGEGEESRDQFETTESEPDVEALIASGEHSYDEVAEIAYPALDESMLGPRPEDASILDDPELIAGVERAQATLDAAEGYAPVTNPEADALAAASDYYSPQAQSEREREESFLNRFNPFRAKVDA